MDFRSLILSLAAAAAGMVTLLPNPAQAQTSQAPLFTTVLQFDGADRGAGPYGPLVLGADGSLYGTTYLGGAANAGTVFRVSPTGTQTVLHSFNGTDGANPQGGLLLASDGFIYGTTYLGGAANAGTIFRVDPASGTFQSVFSFSGTDGANPYSGLAEADGLLYGTTVTGGTDDLGVIFSFPPTSAVTAQVTVRHHFSGGSDGGNPQGAPISGGDGSVYGTAATGGDFQGGTVYRFTPGVGLTTLHAFALGEPTGPAASLVLAADGNFYGTTLSGGDSNRGAIFNITPAGALTTFYSFSGGIDGAAPQCALIQGANGSFYGTTAMGADNNFGVVFGITPRGILTVLHAFSGGADGNLPETGLTFDANGNLFGTTYEGGNGPASLGNGTIFHITFAGSAGSVQFRSSAYSTIESIGTANIAVSRVNGATGETSVDYATSDGTAANGTDYTAMAGTLVWADGDTADKIITVPVLDRHLTDGSTRTVNLALTAFHEGASSGFPTRAVLTIVENDRQPTQPSIAITSPPADVQVVSGTPLMLAANVSDPDAILSRVQFFVNGTLYGQTSASGPFNLSLLAPAPGTYNLSATAIDNEGRQSTANRTITILAPSTTDPAPATNIITDINNRLFASGTTITLSASAESLNTNGEALAGVDFYADDTAIASLDGYGNADPSSAPVGKPRPARVRAPRTSATPGSTPPTIFQTTFTMPNLDKLVNLITVANTQGGRSQVSSTVTIKVTNAGDNKAPTAVLKGITDGTVVNLGSTLTVPVDVSDPDAGAPVTSAWHRGGGRTADITPPAGLISTVEYYLDQLKVGTSSTSATYGFQVTPKTPGMHVLEAIVTDGAGLSNVAPPVMIEVVAPTVTLTLGGDVNKKDVLEGSPALHARVTRTGDLTNPLTVNYVVKGPNVAGVDYKTLPGSVTIPAGAASAKIKVRTFDDGVADGEKLLKLQLMPSADGSYNLGAPHKVKIRVEDAEAAP